MNCQTLFGVGEVRGESQVHILLDPTDPAHIQLMFAKIVTESRQSGALDAMRWLGDHPLTHLAAPSNRSGKIPWPTHSHRKRGKGKIAHSHSMLAVSVMAAGHKRAVPLATPAIDPASVSPK